MDQHAYVNELSLARSYGSDKKAVKVLVLQSSPNTWANESFTALCDFKNSIDLSTIATQVVSKPSYIIYIYVCLVILCLYVCVCMIMYAYECISLHYTLPYHTVLYYT